jgi:hypothetical protein
MLRSRKVLLVFPVPFAALDPEGMPSAAVRFDPPTGRKGEVHFIGATRKNTLVEKRKREEGRQSLYVTSFEYDLMPQRITHTDYHVQRIRQGDLIAADQATAKIAGVPFAQPEVAFERARYAAIARWEQQYGEPPPVESWPELRLLLPGHDAPSTAPAQRAALVAKGAAPVAPVAPVPAPAAAEPAPPAPAPVPAPAPAEPAPPTPARVPAFAPAAQAPTGVPPVTVFAGTRVAHPTPEGAAVAPNAGAEPAMAAPNPSTDQGSPAPDASGAAGGKP